MKYRLTWAVCVVLLVLVQFACLAQTPTVTKYVQPPKDAGSFDFAASVYGGIGYGMADDWVCPNGAPITDIHWWGSYWQKPAGLPVSYSDMLQNADPGGITGFRISIHANEPANATYAFPHPAATALWEGYFSPGKWTEVYDFQVDKGSGTYEKVYKYGVNLSDALGATGGPVPAQFAQQQGQTYWLFITAGLDADGKQWGWHEGNGHWGGYAVQKSAYDNTWGEWYIPCSGHDMAFELTTPVPEPTSLLALGTGVTALFGFMARRRRSS